ncbi:MAG TPA: LemA family protein [Candidatus Nanoarchaeia archaeon]|nr:LemA family protein [Candidatus Nanoarchaeia archaeon]
MLLTLWIAIALLVILVLSFIVYYNRFVVLDNRIDNALAQIDVQLKKRADLVPNLLNSVKGYMKHERAAIKEVTDARKAMLSAPTLEKRAAAGADLQSALKSIFAIAENYPQLKASDTFIQLQNELSDIENKIAYSRQFYNDSIISFNNAVETFPGVLFARLFNKHEKPHLKIKEEEKAVPKVEF